MATKTARRKRCKHCEELFPPDECQGGICERCCEDFEWCSVCQDDINRDAGCRHLYWTDCGYGGCGGTGLDHDDHKAEFFALLDALDSLGQEDLGWAFEPEKESRRVHSRLVRTDGVQWTADGKWKLDEAAQAAGKD